MPEFIKGLISSQKDQTRPREEKFWSMIRQSFVPTLRWSYFVSIMSLIHLVSMITMAMVSSIRFHSLNEKIFLGPLPEALFWVNKNPFQIQKKL